MRRHPPKVSRKKLKAEIESLKGQCLTWLWVNQIMAAVSAVQCAAVMANKPVSESFAKGGVVPNKQEGDLINLEISGGSFLTKEKAEELEQFIKSPTADAKPIIKIYNQGVS